MTRLVVIGAGGIAQNYPDVMASAGAKVVRVVDVDAAKAAALADRFGCDSTTELVLDGADAAVVAVPPAAHLAVVAECFGAGLDVLCEKPLAHSLEAARQMVALSEAHGRRLAMATKYRTCADVLAARQLIADGALGEVRLLEVAFTSAVDMRGRWNGDPTIAGGGVIMDNGSHALDLAAFCVGELTEVLVVEGHRPEGLSVEDVATVHARTTGSATVTIDLAWSIDKSLADFLRIYGTAGELRVGWRDARWRPRGGDWTEIGPGYAKIPAMAGVVTAFMAGLGDGDMAPLTDGRHSALALDAAYRSLHRGGWQQVGSW